MVVNVGLDVDQSAAMPVLTINHITTYQYKRPVAFGQHWMMLRPRDSLDQALIDATLIITPTPIVIRRTQDAFGNHVDIACFAGSAEELRFDSTIRLQQSHADIRELDIAESARTSPFTYGAAEIAALAQFVERQSVDPDGKVARWARTFLKDDRSDTRRFLIDLTHGIKRSFKHVRRDEEGTQLPLQTLALGSGSCRDVAVLMIDAVRSLGMAARFVSGYLYLPDDDDERHMGGGNTHAWVQVYLPGPGWVDFDPSSGIVGNRDLVRIAVAPDARQVIPLHGTWIGRPSDYLRMSVTVAVTSATDVTRRMTS